MICGKPLNDDLFCSDPECNCSKYSIITKEFEGSLDQLVPKVNIITDKLASFQKEHKDFKYRIKLTIGKITSKLCLSTGKMNSCEKL